MYIYINPPLSMLYGIYIILIPLSLVYIHTYIYIYHRNNTTATLAHIQNTSILTTLCYYLGIGFWGAILSFIAAISSLSNLEKYLPFLKNLDPFLYALLEGQLPVLVLILFISLLPLIFGSVSTYIEKRKTHTDVGLEVMTWFWAYSLTNVYLILLAGRCHMS
jgi:hypothetical protein